MVIFHPKSIIIESNSSLNRISGTDTHPPAHQGTPKYNLSKVFYGQRQSPSCGPILFPAQVLQTK